MQARFRFLAVLAAISCTARAAAGAPCLALRPTEVAADWSYAGAEIASFDTTEGNFRVWYATAGKHAPPGVDGSGIPAAVTAAGAAAEAGLARYDELGFRRPVSDAGSPCPSNGGGGRLDLYLFDFNAADGTVVLDSCDLGRLSVTDALETETCAGFMLVENDFAKGTYKSLLEAYQTVVPHELFHLVQSAYSSNGEVWWSEGTAQWATQHVFPELRDLEAFLPAYFQRTERALDFPAIGAAAAFSYGTAIWSVFLAEKLNPALPRSVFEQLALGAGNVLDATESALTEQGAGLADSFAEFARWNLATGARAGAGGYHNAERYPEVKLEPLDLDLPTAVSGKLAGLSARYFRSAVQTRRSIQVSASAQRLDAWFVPLRGGVADLNGASQLPFVADQAGVVVLSGKATDHRDVAFMVEITETPEEPVGSAGAGGAPSDGGHAGVEPGEAGHAHGGDDSAAGASPIPDSAAGQPAEVEPVAGAPAEPRANTPRRDASSCAVSPGAPRGSQNLSLLFMALGAVVSSVRRTSRRNLVPRSLS